MNDPIDAKEDRNARCSELEDAIERACARRATPEMIADLTLRILELDSEPKPKHAQPQGTRILSIVQNRVIAVAALIIFALLSWQFLRRRASKGAPPTVANAFKSHPTSVAVYSPVTQAPLRHIGFQLVGDDLTRAEQEAAEFSASLEVYSLRREIQVTLDTYYDWSESK